MAEIGGGPADALGRPPEFSTRGSTAAEVAQRRFGGPTFIRQKNVTVGTTPTQLYKNDPRRVMATLMNRSVNNGALGFGNELTFATGFLVGANGGEAELGVEDDGEGVTWEIFAINDGAAGVWVVYEVLRV